MASTLLRALSVAATLAMVHGQAAAPAAPATQGQAGIGVILKAQGTAGSPVAHGLQVHLNDPTDANIMDYEELKYNLFNECGRTILEGNLDSGGTTEEALATNAVTAVTKGSKLAVTVSKGGSDLGNGPYMCDLDQTSNAQTGVGEIPLVVQPGTSDGDPQHVNFDVVMPLNLTCIGSSRGNVCLVRCFNPNHYGGCIAIQQTDITPSANNPNTIKTASNLKAIMTQITNNQKDLGTTIPMEKSGTDDVSKANAVAVGLLKAHNFDPAKPGAPASPPLTGLYPPPAPAAPPAAAAPAPATAPATNTNNNKPGSKAGPPPPKNGQGNTKAVNDDKKKKKGGAKAGDPSPEFKTPGSTTTPPPPPPAPAPPAAKIAQVGTTQFVAAHALVAMAQMGGVNPAEKPPATAGPNAAAALVETINPAAAAAIVAAAEGQTGPKFRRAIKLQERKNAASVNGASSNLAVAAIAAGIVLLV